MNSVIQAEIRYGGEIRKAPHARPKSVTPSHWLAEWIYDGEMTVTGCQSIDAVTISGEQFTWLVTMTYVSPFNSSVVIPHFWLTTFDVRLALVEIQGAVVRSITALNGGAA